jgi:hypothetical protein
MNNEQLDKIARDEAEKLYPLSDWQDELIEGYCDGFKSGYNYMKWVSYYEGKDATFPKMTIDGSGEYECSEYVLVLLKDTNQVKAKLEGIVNGAKFWYCPLLDDTLNDVTHWMPLPTPPTK